MSVVFLLAGSVACAPTAPGAPTSSRAPALRGTPSVTPESEPKSAGKNSRPPSEHREKVADLPPSLLHPVSKTPWLGVELTEGPNDAAGVTIRSVFPRSPANGPLLPGDVILSVDGHPTNAPPDVAREVQRHEPGDELAITLRREGRDLLARLRLVGTPDYEDRMRLSWVGAPAPELTNVMTFQGDVASLAELRGKVVVLEFWGSYCGVCRYLAPTLEGWHKTYQSAGVETVGVTMDPPKEGALAGGAFGMSYTLASDLHGEVTQRYHATQIPMVVVIDRTGIVREVMVGYSESRLQTTEKLLKELLDEPRALAENDGR